jgi:hypothetical protein
MPRVDWRVLKSKIFSTVLKNRSSLLQRWRCSCKFRSRRIGYSVLSNIPYFLLLKTLANTSVEGLAPDFPAFIGLDFLDCPTVGQNQTTFLFTFATFRYSKFSSLKQATADSMGR